MAKFSLFIPLLRSIEGGYQNHPGDRGNYNSLGQNVGTNHGISARFYEGVIGRPPSVADMKKITVAEATMLIKVYFWDDVQGDRINNQSVANIIADQDVNSGERPIGLIVQRALNTHFGKRLVEDGDIGPTTAAAINSVNQMVLFNYIKAGRIAYYKSLDEDTEFINGWLERVKKFVYEEKKPLPSGSVASSR